VDPKSNKTFLANIAYLSGQCVQYNAWVVERIPLHAGKEKGLCAYNLHDGYFLSSDGAVSLHWRWLCEFRKRIDISHSTFLCPFAVACKYIRTTHEAYVFKARVHNAY